MYNNKSTFSFILGTVSSGFIYYGLRYLFTKAELPSRLAKAGHSQFLTNLSGMLTIAYFMFNNILLFLPESKIQNNILVSRLRSFVENYLLCMVLALESIVSFVYWTLKIFFVHLILPEPDPERLALIENGAIPNVDVFPMTIDICLHLIPFVALAIQFFYVTEKITVSIAEVLILTFGLTHAYWFWLKYLIVNTELQDYPYPFLNVENERIRYAIFLFVGVLGASSFILFSSLHFRLHSKDQINESFLKSREGKLS